jgi:hypothetical protein
MEETFKCPKNSPHLGSIDNGWIIECLSHDATTAQGAFNADGAIQLYELRTHHIWKNDELVVEVCGIPHLRAGDGNILERGTARRYQGESVFLQCLKAGCNGLGRLHGESSRDSCPTFANVAVVVTVIDDGDPKDNVIRVGVVDID